MEPVEDAGFTFPVCAVTKHVESISTIRYCADADADRCYNVGGDDIDVSDSSVNLDGLLPPNCVAIQHPRSLRPCSCSLHVPEVSLCNNCEEG